MSNPLRPSTDIEDVFSLFFLETGYKNHVYAHFEVDIATMQSQGSNEVQA